MAASVTEGEAALAKLAQSLASSTEGRIASADEGDGHPLTSRERDVLRLVAVGQSNQAIADALFISPATVKRHMTHILAKLGLPSRATAINYAHQHGLVDSHPSER